VDRRGWNEDRERLNDQHRADLWEGMDAVQPGIDRVSRLLREFQEGIVELCEPVAAPRARTSIFKKLGNFKRAKG
jgi:hypothetical protein